MYSDLMDSAELQESSLARRDEKVEKEDHLQVAASDAVAPLAGKKPSREKSLPSLSPRRRGTKLALALTPIRANNPFQNTSLSESLKNLRLQKIEAIANETKPISKPGIYVAPHRTKQLETPENSPWDKRNRANLQESKDNLTTLSPNTSPFVLVNPFVDDGAKTSKSFLRRQNQPTINLPQGEVSKLEQRNPYPTPSPPGIRVPFLQHRSEDQDSEGSIYSEVHHSRPPSIIGGTDEEGPAPIVMSKKQRSLLDSLALPSPVWEVDEKSENSQKDKGAMFKDEILFDDVCTGCGADPVPSFVALIPCDHLLCHTCLNALINSAAHTPPRPMICFACGIDLDSFGPAFEDEGGVGMVNNLLESLKKGESSRVMGKIDIGLAKSRRRGKENFPPNAEAQSSSMQDGYQSYRGKFGHPRDSSGDTFHTRASSGASAISTPHIVSPLSLRYSSNNGGPSSFRTPLVTPVQSRKSNRHLEHDKIPGPDLSPMRILNWSDEPILHYSPEHKSETGIRNISPRSMTIIKAPIEWAVVRIDNIPWDVTVLEIEDWLPIGSLAPPDECVLSVHILCSRGDGRTLNQCYIECASLITARNIVRSRDGRKLRARPVHVTLSSQTQLMTEIFPGWLPGFDSIRALSGQMTGPLLVQTELTGLLSLCKLETTHACKVKERPYYNIVTILQKFPWHQVETYNSKQIVRLFNTSCAAVEILSAVRSEVPEWIEILTTMVSAVTACPVFRPSQKVKFVELTGLSHPKYPTAGLQSKFNLPHGRALFDSTHKFSFSPAALEQRFVTVAPSAAPQKALNRMTNMDSRQRHGRRDSDSDFDESPSKILKYGLTPASTFSFPTPGYNMETPPSGSSAAGTRYHSTKSSLSSNDNQFSPLRLRKPVSPRVLLVGKGLNRSTSEPSLFPPLTPINQEDELEKEKKKGRRISSISRKLGVDKDLVKAMASELGFAVL